MSDTSTGSDGTSVFDTGTTGINTSGLGGLSALLGGGSVASPFDFSGSVSGADGGAPQFDTMQGLLSNWGVGGADQYGQTTPQIQSGDPGAQLQQTDPNQAQQQNASQPTQPAYQQANQPGSLLAAARQMGQPGANPYLIGGGGGVPNQPPLNALMRQAAPPPAPAAPAVPAPAPAAAAPAAAPAPSGGPSAATATEVATPPATGTPDPGSEQDPAQQAAQQRNQTNVPPQVQNIVQNFLRSPVGQLINQLTGGQLTQMLQSQGLGQMAGQAPWLATGGRAPPGTNPMNYPMATPQQIAEFRRTGRMPAQPTGRSSLGTTGFEQPSARSSLGTTGFERASDTGTAPNVFQAGARPMQNLTGPTGGPMLPGQANMTGTVDKSQIPQPSPDVQRAIQQADAAPYPTNTIQGQQANVMATGGPGYTDMQGQRRNGMSPNAIAGVMANIRDESSFNPALRHPDQPGYGGEAHYAHGLYQEGGPDWPAFQRFLNGRDWRNPTLQTQFMMQHFAQRNPQAWNAMNNAQNPGHAAQIFVQNYLMPARQYMAQRSARYARGVPSLQRQLAMQ